MEVGGVWMGHGWDMDEDDESGEVKVDDESCKE